METSTIAAADRADTALLELLQMLKRYDYRFVTPTPATHARVIARPDRQLARTIEDVLGWSLPFQNDALPPELLQCMEVAQVIEGTPGARRGAIRVSSLRGDLFLHSAYPTENPDSVFFGPDTYRFADLIVRELGSLPPTARAHIVDVGTGAGVGAIVAAKLFPAARVTMTDVNAKALHLACLNAKAAGVNIAAVQTAGLDDVRGLVDIVTINPPYIIDKEARTYRDGGGTHGGELSVELTEAALGRLARGGRIILYTGSAIVRGRDVLREALTEKAGAAGCTLRYAELDPDVFGEELESPPYADVDRIALVAAILDRPE